MGSPAQAPNYILIRKKVSAADSAPYTVSSKGCHCSDYQTVNFQIVPGVGDSVTAKFFSWCPSAGAFIAIADTVTWGPYTSPVDISYPVNGRTIFVELKGTVADTNVYASYAPRA